MFCGEPSHSTVVAWYLITVVVSYHNTLASRLLLLYICTYKYTFTYVRHFRRKHIKSRSADLIDVAKSLEAGRRIRPLLFRMQRGWFRESKKRRRRVASVTRPSGGIPSVSMIQANCSTCGNNEEKFNTYTYCCAEYKDLMTTDHR